MIETLNLKALGLPENTDGVPAGVTLLSYTLSQEQGADPSLDIVTGFQVLLPQTRIIVIEGPAKGSAARIWNEISRPETDSFRSLFNSELCVGARLYAELGPALRTMVSHASSFC